MLNAVILFNLCVATCYATTMVEDWTLSFNNSNISQLEMGSSTDILAYVYTNTFIADENLKLQMITTDEDVAYVRQNFFDLPKNRQQIPSNWSFHFNLTAEFLGYTKLYLRVVEISEFMKY
jgi:hypothetical protein